MSATIITMRRTEGDLSAAAETLRRELSDDVETFSVKTHGSEGKQAILVNCEKYIFRTNGYVTLNVMLTDLGGVQTADIVASGADGPFDIRPSINPKFAKKAEMFLESCGFATVEKTLKGYDFTIVEKKD